MSYRRRNGSHGRARGNPWADPRELMEMRSVWDIVLGNSALVDLKGNEIQLPKDNEFNHDNKVFKIKTSRGDLMIPCPSAVINYGRPEWLDGHFSYDEILFADEVRRNYLLLWGESVVLQLQFTYMTNAHPEYPEQISSVYETSENDFMVWAWKSEEYFEMVKRMWKDSGVPGHPEDCPSFSRNGRFKIFDVYDYVLSEQNEFDPVVMPSEYALKRDRLIFDVILRPSMTDIWDYFVHRVNEFVEEINKEGR